MKRSRQVPLFFLIAICSIPAAAQKFTYVTQRKLIPAELGQVYLGMPLKAFASKIPLDGAEADTRFPDWLELTVPFKRGNITSLTIRISGLDQTERSAIVTNKKLKEKDLNGEYYERDAEVLDASKIPSKGVVYAMYIGFVDDFDLEKWTSRTYGKPRNIHNPGEEGYFYDHQWTRKTTDGLTWLIRSYFKEKKSLQLLGRIKGTEWEVN